MSAQEIGMHPLQALAAAEREYAAGNYVESSRILWQATEATYAMLAKAHGLDAGDLIAVAKALDRKRDGIDPTFKHYYLGYLISGWLMEAHAEMEALEDYELESPHQRLPTFIRKCYREFGDNDITQ